MLLVDHNLLGPTFLLDALVKGGDLEKKSHEIWNANESTITLSSEQTMDYWQIQFLYLNFPLATHLYLWTVIHAIYIPKFV